LAKKINARLKRSYHYFGIDEVVAYEYVKGRIEHLKGIPAVESVSIKVLEYADEIAEYFENEKRVNETDFPVAFSKDEPRRSWEHYTDDFPEDIFDDLIEPVEQFEIFLEDNEEESSQIYIEALESDDEEGSSQIYIEALESDDNFFEDYEEESSLFFEEKQYKAKIFLNNELLGYTWNPIVFTEEMREKRRNGKISQQMNITFYEDTNEIYIFNDSGRARRPLIIVKKGKPLLNEIHLKNISNGQLQWDDLITHGVIEFLDAEEEENSYIAMSLDELTNEHTHLEIDPSTMLGVCAGLIPFANHNSSPRNTMEAGMTKQALGLYVSNHAMRSDIRAHLLHNLQTPIVKTRSIDSTNYDLRPSGQNFVIAVMSYEGYNMESGMVFNKSSLERGLGRSSFFRTYDTSEKRYAGGQVDKFEVPDKIIKGYRSEEVYRNLDDDGIVYPEVYVESGDVLIGRTSPPRFLEENFESSVSDRRRETSVTVRQGEKGIVDAVLITETSEGSRVAKVRVRDTRQPELGDKFASRHGQKGVMGLIVSPEDMPFSEFGTVPDLIVNPHEIPSRMTVGQTLEILAGKSACLEGERIDATPFNKNIVDDIKQQLISNGFESAGCESLYDGVTGERFEAEIFVGVAYYQKLHHMTTDKIYSRARGPVQVLTRQPTEGRAREGGLRFGEMERDALIAHGAAMTLKERLLDESDRYEAIVCDTCGMLAVFDKNKNKKYCPICGDVETYPVEISYAFKLLLDELKSLCIYPKLILGDKTEIKKPFKRKSSFKPKPLEDNTTLITKTSLSQEEPLKSDISNDEKLGNCIICGKKLNKNQKQVCKSCARKQYASRIIKKLSSAVKPTVPFKKDDLKPLKLVDLQIKDYIWTLQEFDLIEVDNNKFTLNDEKTLNDFRVKSGFDPIDFENIDGLDKTCKTCGKTLPLSQFYKTSEGYEDNCKNCKKLLNSASYLNELINYFGFDNEFGENDLKEYVSNPNQLNGMIWALLDQDLLTVKEPNVYVISDKDKSLEFLNKYLDKSISQKVDVQKKSEKTDIKQKEDKAKPKTKVVKKTKSKEKSKSKKKAIKQKSKKTETLTKKQTQMNTVIEARKSGKSREESAQIAEIPLYKIIHWYKEGKQGFGEDNVRFYNELQKIEDKLLNSSESNERKQMEFVLKLLRQGKTPEEISKLTELNVSTFTSWYNQGKEKRNVNTIYFYKEVKKINTGKNKVNKLIKVENKGKKDSNISPEDERKLMDDVLKLIRQGNSRQETAKELKIEVNKISSWIDQGKVRHDENTVYFYNEMMKIRKYNDKIDLKSANSNFNAGIKSKPNSEREMLEMKIVLDELKKGKSRVDAAIKAEIPVTKISKWQRNGEIGYNQDAIDFLNELKKIDANESHNVRSGLTETDDRKSTQVNVEINDSKSQDKNLSRNNEINSKIDLNNEKQVMDAILSLMGKGYSRVQAAQEVGIKIGQIVIWYTQGRNNKSPNTVYFYNQLNRIEKR